MKTKTLLRVLLAAAILAATATGFYALGKHQLPLQNSMSTVVGEGNSANNMPNTMPNKPPEKKALYWHDPMVPTQKFDKPGKSPFMDMQLVPVYADEGSDGSSGGSSDEGTLHINPRVQQNLGIRTAEVSVGKLASTLAAVGSVAYNERDLVLVSARNNGYVEKLHVRATLDMVRKGQVLAELYVPDWIAAQEEFLSVQRMTGQGMEGLADGARQRLLLAGMNEAQIHQVERSGKVQARIAITAPADGVVTELTAREGMTVTAGAPLFRINGVHTIWVNADVPENAVTQLHAGMAVEARTPSLPAMVFKGKLSAILGQVNPATRTLVARIELANHSAQLLPGMFANISFMPADDREVLLIPSEAVIQTGTRTLVMLAQGDGKFAPVVVQAGAEANGQTEIRSGLQAGQKVVVSGQFLIDSEASLKGTANRMGSVVNVPANAAANASTVAASKAGSTP